MFVKNSPFKRNVRGANPLLVGSPCRGDRGRLGEPSLPPSWASRSKPDLRPNVSWCVSVLIAQIFLVGCACHSPGSHERRTGDEIVVAGQFFHTGTPVVLWMDPGGYDAYRVERRFAPYTNSDFESSRTNLDAPRKPNRYDIRDHNLTPEELERVRGGGWDLPTLQSNVDQFVIHFDVAGISRTCFKVLQDSRDLSVHFMLDLDGTIYQTLDLKERARHATIANNRSVGIEIANMGSYASTEKSPGRVVQDRGRWPDRYYHTQAGRPCAGANASFCRPSCPTPHHRGGGARQKDESIRFHETAIPGPGKIDRRALHRSAKNHLRLSARSRRHFDDAQDTG